MKPDTRASIIGWLGLACMAALLIIFGLWCADPAGAQPLQPCVTTDITPTLWPRADFPVAFHPGAEPSLSTIPRPLDNGALRWGAGGCLEILRGPGADAPVWARYNPADYSHWLDATKFQRYGRGHSHGHGHGVDAIAAIAYSIWPVLFGRPAVLMDELDTYYRTTGGRNWWVYGLIKEYDSKTGGQQPPKDCGDGACDPRLETADTCPADCPKIPPVNPNCDGICQEGLDRVCREGAPAAGRCPSDCEAPCPPPEPPPCNGICDRASDIVRCPEDCLSEPPPICPSCPPCETAEVKAALDRCEAEAGSCGAERGLLKSRVVELEVHLDGALRSLGACETMIDALTAERDGLKAMHAEPLPADLETYLRTQKPPLLSGLGRRAKYRRLAGPVCQRWSCPEDLKP